MDCEEMQCLARHVLTVPGVTRDCFQGLVALAVTAGGSTDMAINTELRRRQPVIIQGTVNEGTLANHSSAFV